MTEDAKLIIFRLGLLILLGMVIQLGVIIYIFSANYEGRKEQVKNSRAGCERSKLDRADNAAAWRIAQTAREHDADLGVAHQYSIIASNLERRSRINCAKAFPKASFLR